MSYQGKKNIPRITVSLVLGKSAVGLHTFCGTEHRRNFLKGGGGRRTQLPPPPPLLPLLKAIAVVGDAII